MKNDLGTIITLVGGVLNFLMGIYILFVIPSRQKKILSNQDMISKNQGIIERKLK